MKNTMKHKIRLVRTLGLAIMTLIITCYSCTFNQKTIEGKYCFTNNYCIMDSLVLCSNNTYSQSLYNSLTKKLLFRNTGTWISKGRRIELKNFILCEEIDTNSSFSNNSEIYTTSSFSLRKKNGNPAIVINHDLGKYYVKMK